MPLEAANNVNTQVGPPHKVQSIDTTVLSRIDLARHGASEHDCCRLGLRISVIVRERFADQDLVASGRSFFVRPRPHAQVMTAGVQ